MTRSRGRPSAGTKRTLYDEHEEDSHTMQESTNGEESTIRILIASDNHIGYAERDPVRGEDSYNSFREVLEIAKAEDVDMVLLAGDLFHENKPSRRSMFQAMRSLRMNCLGDKPCQLEVLGDQSVATEDSAVMHINYLDPEINVAIPVFSIHGNHDDPSGEGRLCALDILQVSGLLNYYGRVPESDHIVVKPVLLQKGSTKLALYGLSNVRDERLHRSFRHNQVKFMRPELYQDEWFNLIAVHQNHHGHSETNYLPENFLQNFFDFVVWGHEHECLIDPILNPEQDFHVCQPGSSVATSLCKGEAGAKHVGVLSIRAREFKMRKIPLKTVRPFVMRELSLTDNTSLNPKRKNKSDVIAYLMQEVNQAIEEANIQWRDVQDDRNTTEEPPLPLIRLRVDYSSAVGQFEIENPQRFSQRFLGRVANANDVVQFHVRKKAAAKKQKGTVTETEKPDLADVRLAGLKVASLVKQFLSKQSLQCLPENELEDAVTQFVEKDDRDAVKDFVRDHLASQVAFMMDNRTNESNLTDVMARTKDTMSAQFKVKRDNQEKQKKKREEARVSDFSDEENEIARRSASPVQTRTTKTTKKPPTKKRKKDESESEPEEDEDISEVSDAAPKARAKPKPAATPRTRSTPARKPAKPTRQAQLSFSTSQASPPSKSKRAQQTLTISSDEDDFLPVPSKRK